MLHHEVAPCVASCVYVVAINKALADDLGFLFGAKVTESQLPVIASCCYLVEELFPIVHISHLQKRIEQDADNVNKINKVFLFFFRSTPPPFSKQNARKL